MNKDPILFFVTSEWINGTSKDPNTLHSLPYYSNKILLNTTKKLLLYFYYFVFCRTRTSTRSSSCQSVPGTLSSALVRPSTVKRTAVPTICIDPRVGNWNN